MLATTEMPAIETLQLPGLLLFTPDKHEDSRGWFVETWRADVWRAAGVETVFVQENESYSARRGTMRGLHYQIAPHAQAKLVRVLSGRILDVAVDLRPGSSTFGKHASVELGAEDGRQLYIPEGFAHGFCSLEEHTRIAYKVSSYYSPQHDRGIRWNDPDLKISWPYAESELSMSEKDRNLPLSTSSLIRGS